MQTRKRWVYTQGGKPLPEPIEVEVDVVPLDAPTAAPLVLDRAGFLGSFRSEVQGEWTDPEPTDA